VDDVYEWLILAALVVTVALLCFVVLRALAGRRQRAQRRLVGSEHDIAFDSEPELVLGPLTPALGGPLPGGTSGTELELELRDAGYYRPTALMEYRAIRAVLVILPLVAAGVLMLLVEREQMLLVGVLGLIGAVLGFSLPRVYINQRARWRARQIERGLPVAVDLLALALTAGLNILTAFQRVSQQMRFSYPVLAGELLIVSRQADLRSLEHALRQLAARVRVPEVRTLALILVQSEQLGTDINTALLEFSSNFRTTMKQRAEGQANRASFWMIFPSLFCLWIPAAVLLIAPVYYQFWRGRGDVREILVKNQAATREAAAKSRMPQEPGQGLVPEGPGQGQGAPLQP
jgi:tight adherence protein C